MILNYYWLVCGIVWLVSGVISFGMTLAYYQRRWPMLAELHYRQDRRCAWFTSFLGPTGMIYTITNHGFRYGMMFRRRHLEIIMSNGMQNDIPADVMEAARGIVRKAEPIKTQILALGVPPEHVERIWSIALMNAVALHPVLAGTVGAAAVYSVLYDEAHRAAGLAPKSYKA